MNTLSKMPKVDNAKTGSAPRHPQRKRLVFSLLLIIGLFFVWGGVVKAPSSQLTINGHHFSVEYADTPAAQEKGLGGRDSLAPYQGMLFRFPEAAQHCFWMKDMRFSLDIIWLDSAKRVVHIEQAVSPDSYPKNYCPDEAARYVLEVNAGTAQQLNLRVGDSLSF